MCLETTSCCQGARGTELQSVLAGPPLGGLQMIDGYSKHSGSGAGQLRFPSLEVILIDLHFAATAVIYSNTPSGPARWSQSEIRTWNYRGVLGVTSHGNSFIQATMTAWCCCLRTSVWGTKSMTRWLRNELHKWLVCLLKDCHSFRLRALRPSSDIFIEFAGRQHKTTA